MVKHMAKFNDALHILGELTTSEKAVIARCLYSEVDSKYCVSTDTFMINTRFQGNVCCVKCGSTSIVKNGKRKDGTQKYICKDCGLNFTSTSGTVISRSKKSLDTWVKYINCMLEDNTLLQCADKCGIHLNTAFLWRHKLLEASQKANSDIVLEGNIEMDETYFRTSYKGNHSKWPTSFVIPREAYERGHHSRPGRDKNLKNKARAKGLSMDQVCVPCAITPNRLTVAKVCKLGSASSNGLFKVFKNHIAPESTIISDEYKAYSKFSKQMNINLIQIDDDKPIEGINIQQVDSLHSQMKRMFNHRYCGVATKYLNNYIEMIRINLIARRSRESKLDIIMNLLINFTGCTRQFIYNKSHMPVLC